MTPNDSESHYYDEEGYPDPPDNHVFDPYPPELTQENLDGFIYMMANPGMTDRVKIGYGQQRPVSRVARGQNQIEAQRRKRTFVGRS